LSEDKVRPASSLFNYGEKEQVPRDKVDVLKGVENQLRALFVQEFLHFLSSMNGSVVPVENPIQRHQARHFW
jgi:hypothetical protein